MNELPGEAFKHPGSFENAEAIANRITWEGRWEETARKHTCLLGWNAGQLLPEPLADNGTCCLIQTRVRRFVVTCEHVWRGYEAFWKAHIESRLWINLVRDDQVSAPSAALTLSNPQIIAADKSLDLAVFTFDEIDTLEPCRFWPFRFATASKTNKGDIVHFLGFPGEALRAGASKRILNYCFSSRPIHDVGHTKFMLHSAPGTMHHKNRAGDDCAAFRICGASGAPVFKVGQNFSLSLAGVISDLGSSGCGSATQPYEMSDGDIYITHACFIQEDGSIVPS